LICNCTKRKIPRGALNKLKYRSSNLANCVRSCNIKTLKGSMKTSATILAAAICAGSAMSSARAGGCEWSTASKILTGIFGAATVAQAFYPPPVYAAPVIVAQPVPPTVVYAPAPQVVYAAPQVVVGAPAVVVARPVYLPPAVVPVAYYGPRPWYPRSYNRPQPPHGHYAQHGH
jgi:hypothetical protein